MPAADTIEPKTKRTVEINVIGKLTASIDIPDELDIPEGDVQASEQVGVFRVLTPKDGDKRITWDRMRMASINAARDMFNACIGEGLVPYRIGADGKKSEIMREFDPYAQEVIFIPQPAVIGG